MHRRLTHGCVAILVVGLWAASSCALTGAAAELPLAGPQDRGSVLRARLAERTRRQVLGKWDRPAKDTDGGFVLAGPSNRQGRSLQGFEGVAANAADASPTAAAAAAVQYRIILHLKPGALLATILQRVLGLEADEVASKVLSRSMRLYAVDANPDFLVSTDELVSLLDADPDVEFAERDTVMNRRSSRRLQAGAAAPPPAALKPATATNDPLFPGQWDKRLIGLTARSSTYPGAWSRGVGNQEVVVCVIDTGIDTTHPDLVANLWVNPGEIPGNGIDDDGNGYIDDIHGINPVANNSDIMDTDSSGHGTHCAGNVGAVGNNEIGMSGVNQVVRIMGCKAQSSGGEFQTSHLIECLSYALDNGAHITSNSYGGPGGNAAETRSWGVALKAVTAAGQLFVAAAGNEANDIDKVLDEPAGFQAHYPIVMPIAATDIDDDLASFSNFGVENVAIAAPGVKILSTVPGGRFELLDGTSMACPIAAGAAALVLGIYGTAGANMTGRGPELRKLLMETVEPIDALTGIVKTGGRLDVGQAALAIPSDSTLAALFAKDPNAPLPYTVPKRPAPEFKPSADVYTVEMEMQIGHPGQEITNVAIPLGEFLLPPVQAEFFNDSASLSDGSATYPCSCSYCPGPEVVYSFSMAPDEDPTLAWYLLTVEAAPNADIVISIYQANITDAPGFVVRGGAENYPSTTAHEPLALLGCGGTAEAVKQAVIQAGQEYYVIIDGIGTYDGAYEVHFSAEPLGTQVAWDAIASPDGYTSNGTLVGAPVGLVFSFCPNDTNSNPQLFWSFVAEENATVLVASGPYYAQSRGVAPSAGQMCTLLATNLDRGLATLGSCAYLQYQSENNITATPSEQCPVYSAALYAADLTQLQVIAGERYYVAVTGADALGDVMVSISVVPTFAAEPQLKLVEWSEITAGLSATSSAYGYLDSGNNTDGTQFHDCPCSAGDCNGPEVIYSFTAGAYGFVAISAGPFYDAADLGMEGQAPCIGAACYQGVFPYVYKFDDTAGSYEEVKCGTDYIHPSSKDNSSTLVLGLSVETGVSYYVVIDSITSQVLQQYLDDPYYLGSYQTHITWMGTPDDYMTPICSIPYYQKESAANVSSKIAFSSALTDCAEMPGLNSHQSWHRYTPAEPVRVDISACPIGDTPVAVTVVEEGPLMYGIGQRTLADQTCSASSSGVNSLCSQALGVPLQADTTYYIVVDFLKPFVEGHPTDGLQLCVQVSPGLLHGNVSSTEGECVGWPGATPARNLFKAADKRQCAIMIN